MGEGSSKAFKPPQNYSLNLIFRVRGGDVKSFGEVLEIHYLLIIISYF